MCIIFFSVNSHPKYKFILASNRDEYYERTTKAAEFWQPDNRILAGRDLGHGAIPQELSSWLGVTRNGRIAFLTNFRSPQSKNSNALSRGHIVANFLAEKMPAPDYLDALANSSNTYNGFNVVMGDINDMHHYSNHNKSIAQLTPGIYALSNHLLDTPWPKVVKGKALFNAVLEDDVSHANLFNILQDQEIYPDALLPHTGLSIERERALSSIFVATPNYGTRSSSVLTLDRFGQLEFTERTYDVVSAEYRDKSYTFLINNRD